MKIGRFEVEHDGNGWILWETKTAISRDTKEPKPVRHPRYFANCEQCCNKIIDLSAADADTASEVVEAIQRAKREIVAVLKDKDND